MKPFSSTPLLSLSKKEQLVFSALSGTPQSIADIARKTKLPVRTAGYTIQKLHGRAVVRKVSGAHPKWKRAGDGAISRQIRKASQEIADTPLQIDRSSRAFTFSRPKIKVRLIKGAKNITLIYHDAYAGHKDERLFLTQAPSAVHKFASNKKTEELLHRMNKIGEKHKGILELIINEDTTRLYSDYAKNPKWVESQEKRLLDVSLVDREYLPDTFAEIFIFRDNVMLTDWESEIAVILTNHEIAKLARALFRASKALGRTFDAHGLVNLIHQQKQRS